MKDAVNEIRKLAEKGMLAEDSAAAFRKDGVCYVTVRNADLKNLTETDLIVVRDDSDVSPDVMPKEYFLYLAIFEIFPKVSAIIRTSTESIRTASIVNRKVRPMLDDMAQIVGVSVRSVDEDVFENAQKIVKATSAMKDRTALLIQNNGAVCVGATFDDAEVSAVVFEKACKTVIESSFLGGGRYINPIECWLMHLVYKLKYSKQAKK